MTIKLFSKLAFLAIIGLTLFSSCTEENSVTPIVTEEAIEFEFRMTVNGASIDVEAYAAYCTSDSVNFLVISNKVENLNLGGSNWDFEEGDFTFYNFETEGEDYGFGGMVLGQDITGVDLLINSSSNATIQIDSNDGNVVVGSSEGTLYGIDPATGMLTDPYDYSISFTAQLETGSNVCQ